MCMANTGAKDEKTGGLVRNRAAFNRNAGYVKTQTAGGKTVVTRKIEAPIGLQQVGGVVMPIYADGTVGAGLMVDEKGKARKRSTS